MAEMWHIVWRMRTGTLTTTRLGVAGTLCTATQFYYLLHYESHPNPPCPVLFSHLIFHLKCMAIYYVFHTIYHSPHWPSDDIHQDIKARPSCIHDAWVRNKDCCFLPFQLIGALVHE